MKKIIAILLSFSLIFAAAFTMVGAAKNSKNVMTLSADNIAYDISDELYGLFIEDISYACDGGLVSNLVDNNSFEYEFDHISAWKINTEDYQISSDEPLNENNPNYLNVNVNGSGTIENKGFPVLYNYKTYDVNEELRNSSDMGFKEGEEYAFTAYFKNIDYAGKVTVSLNLEGNTENYQFDLDSCEEWTKISLTIKSEATGDGSLLMSFEGNGNFNMDFVSLVPTSSYGYGTEEWKYVSLRADLYDALKNLSPQFVRFPGGCLAEGDSLENLYDWKSTIGPLEERTQSYNLWRDDWNGRKYINTNSMGYHEYFTLCDDLGATPIPILNVGLICQGRCGYGDYETRYKNGEISQKDWEEYLTTIALTPGTDEWEAYVQDVLDLIEYANGDVNTEWGAKRAENGHAEPFNMKYLGLGNENWGEVYWRNFQALYEAIKAVYPEITIVTSAGCTLEGEDFDKAWEIANTTYPDTIVDEHYYTQGGYLFRNTNRYDSYERTGAKVFVGEYAPTADGVGTLQTKNNIWAAVESAAYLTGIERNGDVVQMISYAPTFAKNNAQAWSPNLIWFDSQEVVLTPDYYTQMLFSNNYGDKYITSDFDMREDGIYSSTTVDTEEQVIYVKLVNSTAGSEKITVNLEGFENVNNPSVQYMSETFKAAHNEFGENVHVAPVEEKLEVKDNSIQYKVGSYSVSVIRIPYGDNDGSELFKLPESIGIISPFIHPALEIAIPCVLGLLVVITGAAVLIVRIKHNRKIKKAKKESDSKEE